LGRDLRSKPELNAARQDLLDTTVLEHVTILRIAQKLGCVGAHHDAKVLDVL
jgi:hypothetical protein